MEQTSGQPAIELRDVHKRFGDEVVLGGVNLTVAPGETVGILGRSGTGKSVLLKLIIGLQQADRGSIRIHGQDITGLALDQLNDVRLSLGFLFQEAALYDSLTIEENVLFPLQRHRRGSAAEQTTRARTLLADMGMADDRHKRPADVSGGMRKRVGLARALALDPDILLFDEPTAGLDPITAGEIDALILRLKHERQVASVVVTHDLHSARAIADRLAFLDEGRIVIEGRFEELQRDGRGVVSEFLKQTDTPRGD